jgi:protein-tyrosine phosphatase
MHTNLKKFKSRESFKVLPVEEGDFQNPCMPYAAGFDVDPGRGMILGCIERAAAIALISSPRGSFMTVTVTFVCLGNICRSPMAEAVFRNLVHQAGLDDQIKVDSCGTGSWHIGEAAHSGTQAVLRQHGIPCHHTARKLSKGDLAEADYLIAMDKENLEDIHRFGETRAETGLLLNYAPTLGLQEVPDPYYTNRFEEVYNLVEAGCAGLLAHIRQEERL